ncbi:MAG: DUF4065 domain-containing protein [Rhodobiaceae bacterium]|nr:DUF4065 domain-containing protein [Rhodobiaceae bacterium]
MSISILSAAKRLAEQSDWSLSNLKLQKILYLAHMFYLGRTEGEPLVRGEFEAWNYGPVHPDLYHKAKVFGSDPVKNIFHSIPEVPGGAERDIIDEAFESLGSSGPGRLVAATHRKNGAWEKNFVPGEMHCIIPNEDILAEYRSLNGART